MKKGFGSAPHIYIAIDLKSFYASVECRERQLDPLDTNLVVADPSRTEKTICLAVSPSLKAYGIPGRARLFEVVQRVKEVNAGRRRRLKTGGAPASPQKPAFAGAGHESTAGPVPAEKESGFSGRQEESGGERLFSGRSVSAEALASDPSLEVDYVVAPPRMSLYMDYSAKIYNIYMKYVAPEDVHVYSIDEVFLDATKYLDLYGISAHALARRMIRDVLSQTGITATAGIGTNLYLAKVAMDVEAKHVEADADGVRIAELDEMSYRLKLWCHRPLTDFWRVGRGYARKLEAHGIYTMGDVARCSLEDEDLLYSLFGVNAELLIDHAWGWEPCTIDLIKAYQPEDRSFSHGQVLQCPYDFDRARVVVHEMADAAALDLVEKGMTTDQLVLTVGYDVENLARIEKLREDDRDRGPGIQKSPGAGRQGSFGAGPQGNRRIDRRIEPDLPGTASIEITRDRFGRKMPKHAHGTANLMRRTNASSIIDEAVLELYDRIVDPRLLVRRMYVSVNHVLPERSNLPAGVQSRSPSEKKNGIAAAEMNAVSEFPAEPGGGPSGQTGGFDFSFQGTDPARESDRYPEEPAGTWEQMNLFTDYEALQEQQEAEKAKLEKERRLQEAMLSIRGRYGKNAILKGINFREGATGRERNAQIGGHKAE